MNTLCKVIEIVGWALVWIALLACIPVYMALLG